MNESLATINELANQVLGTALNTGTGRRNFGMEQPNPSLTNFTLTTRTTKGRNTVKIQGEDPFRNRAGYFTVNDQWIRLRTARSFPVPDGPPALRRRELFRYNRHDGSIRCDEEYLKNKCNLPYTTEADVIRLLQSFLSLLQLAMSHPKPPIYFES